MISEIRLFGHKEADFVFVNPEQSKQHTVILVEKLISKPYLNERRTLWHVKTKTRKK